jgi:ankyrin repeat protein
MNNYIKTELSEERLNNEVNKAVQSNDLEYLKYLFSSPELKTHANPNANGNRCFELACGYGHLDIVKYLINSPNVKFDTSRKILINSGIIFSISHNQKDLLDYFRYEAQAGTKPTESELETEDKRVLERACAFGYVEIVDYVFKNPKTKIDSKYINQLFEQAIYNGHPDLARYFIFEKNIDKTDSLQKILLDITDPERKEIENLFELRDTHNSLQQELENNEISNSKRIKI